MAHSSSSPRYGRVDGFCNESLGEPLTLQIHDHGRACSERDPPAVHRDDRVVDIRGRLWNPYPENMQAGLCIEWALSLFNPFGCTVHALAGPSL